MSGTVIHMARRGPAYPVTQLWKEAVRARMKEAQIDQRALAKRIKCAQSTLAELLGDGSRQSSLVPDIHKALGWPAPAAPSASPDVGEMAYLFPLLPEELRSNLLQQAKFWIAAKKTN